MSDGTRDALRRWARRGLPWLAAVALFAWLLARVPVGAVRAALHHGSYLPLAAWMFFSAVAILPLDAFAIGEALALTGIHRAFKELLLVRGASYLLGLVSYLAGQGGVGVWLARRGVRASRATGAMLLLMSTIGIALASVASLGLLADLPADRRRVLVLLTAGVFAGIAVYLALIGLRVRWLAERSVLAPVFEAGVGGHLRAAAARLPHVLVMAALQWAAARIWGLAIPFWNGLALNSLVLLVGALPITPSGLGTTQVLQVVLFAPWSPAATPDARAADVLAFSVVSYTFGLLSQALVGVACLAVLRRSEGGAAAEDAV